MNETITVTIHGVEYKLRGDNAERVRRAAELVNEQMRSVSGRAPAQPTATVAVLAALNAAEQTVSEHDRQRRDAADLVRRIDGLTTSIEGLLGYDE